MELTLRDLNRTLLGRQMLLERRRMPVARAVERVGPLQAQYVPSPYVALWSRLDGFRKDTLTRALTGGRVVQSGVVRGTLHLTTRGDFPSFAAAYVEPQIRRAERSGVDVHRLRAAIGDEPMAPDAARARAGASIGTDDRWEIAFALRTLPWVRLPPCGTWGNHRPGESQVWAISLPSTETGTALAVRRYLSAFGPATRKDVEHFLGLPVRQLEPALEPMRRLETEHGVLYDVPRGRFTPAAAPAPPRFLHSFDSAYLAHADKSRICAPEHEDLVYRKKNATMNPIFLVDGFVAGIWKIERTKKNATLSLQPFSPLPRAARTDLVAEGERLLRWYEDDATSYAVSVAAPA